jgi:large subunit ribosomal protein L3
MSIGILGKKLGMTQIYTEEGQAVPVTVVEAGPCSIVDIKTPDRNGYSALSLGFGEIKPQKLTRPVKGIFDAAKVEPRKVIREFRVDKTDEFSVGQEIKVDLFEAGEKVNVTGVSKGKGFAGVIKRYGYGGNPATHGVSKTHRKPGSSGGSSYPGKVFKGKTMPGRMGNERVTVKNLEVVAVDPGNNLLLVKGAVPGAKNALVMVTKQG